jgi:hypothetical protein
VRRLKPTTSAARMAASFRVSATAVPSKDRPSLYVFIEVTWPKTTITQIANKIPSARITSISLLPWITDFA